MRELAGKELTHRALDELAAGKTVEHLRSVLVAIGTLPERDEQMSRLERWTAWVIAETPDPGPAVHLCRVDLALDPAGERVQSAGQVVPARSPLRAPARPARRVRPCRHPTSG